MSFHCVLKHWHPMLGCDIHIPNTPIPLPPAPYVTFQIMFGVFGITAQYAVACFTDHAGMTMLKGTDIGPLIPHIGPPSVTLPLEILLSSSKSYFAVSKVQAGGKPVVACLALFLNPNLNCGTPIPTPTGLVLGITTHVVDMTWADIMGGFAAMRTDMLIQAVLNFVGGKLGESISKCIGPRIAAIAASSAGWETAQYFLKAGMSSDAIELLSGMAAKEAQETAKIAVEQFVGGAVSFFGGGPMGMDASTFGGKTPAGVGSDMARDKADESGRKEGEYMDNPDVPNANEGGAKPAPLPEGGAP